MSNQKTKTERTLRDKCFCFSCFFNKKMKRLVLFFIAFFILAFFYVKKVKKNFTVKIKKIKQLEIKDNLISALILLKIDNPILPDFKISEVDLFLFLNNKKIAPVKSVGILANGYVDLFFKTKMKSILTVDNLINAITGNNKITLKGSLKVSKGIVKQKINVNESFFF